MRKAVNRYRQHNDKSKYEELANALPVIIFEADLMGIITFANQRALDSLGYTPKDIDDGMYVWKTVIAEERNKARQRFKQLLKGEKLSPVEYIALRKDGSTLPVITDSSLITTEGRVIGTRSAILDISEHKQAEKTASEREKRYRDLFNYASDAIFIRDLQGNIIETNKRASFLTGYSPDELIKMNVSQLMTPESFNRAMLSQQEAIAGKTEDQRYELDLIKKDGTTRTVESVTSLIINGNPVGVQAIVRDVTAQKRQHHIMQYYISRSTRAQEEARRRVARELHDDTIQSLARLSLDIQATARDVGCLPNAIIQAQLEKMRQTIGNVIEGLRRLTHNLRPDILDHLGLVPAIKELAQNLNEEKTVVQIETTGLQRRLKDEVEVGLFRIAQEALNNVRWHAQATRVDIKICFTPDSIHLSITDNGKGFELPEAIGNLATSGNVGLINMQERTRLLNGVLSINSTPGRGTEIAVEVRERPQA